MIWAKKHRANGEYILAKIACREAQTVEVMSVGPVYLKACEKDGVTPLKVGDICRILIGDHPIVKFNGEDVLVLNSFSIVSVEE